MRQQRKKEEGRMEEKVERGSRKPQGRQDKGGGGDKRSGGGAEGVDKTSHLASSDPQAGVRAAPPRSSVR